MSPTDVDSPLKELDNKYIEIIGKFVSDVRNGKLQGSNNIAIATVSFLEQIINDSESATAFELCGVLRAVGARLVGALPQELVAHNMLRRLLRAVRDENRHNANQSGEGAGESLQRLVLAASSRRATLGPAEQDLREPIRDFIAELRTELETSASSISGQARELLHAEELVLTYGAGALVERFLRAAAPRRYRLILAEGPDVRESHGMASRLSNAGVPVTVINVASVFAVMSRVNKVVVGVQAALGGGAALAASGLGALTAAAQHYSVPVLALAPLYKLSPLHACEPQHFSCLASPAGTHTLPYERHESGEAHVFAPRYDFVPPDHVTLFITNLGGSAPSYMYRLLSELYDPKDYQL